MLSFSEQIRNRKMLSFKKQYEDALDENLKWFVKLHEARGVKFPKLKGDSLTQRDIIELICQGVFWQPYLPLVIIDTNGNMKGSPDSVKDGIKEMNRRTEQYKREIKMLEEKMSPKTERDHIMAVAERLINLYEYRDITDKNWLALEEKYLVSLKEAIEERLIEKKNGGF